MATVRWPRNCEYARQSSESKARLGHQKLARAIVLIAEPEARRLTTEVMVDLADIRQMMADAKHGDPGTFELATTTAATTAHSDGR